MAACVRALRGMRCAQALKALLATEIVKKKKKSKKKGGAGGGGGAEDGDEAKGE